MTENSLSDLYRRMNAQALTPAGDLLDTDTLIAASTGSLSGDRRDEVAARLSRCEAQTDLVRLLRELSGDATQLAAAVNSREYLAHSHARDGRRVRHGASGNQRLQRVRWAGLAACLMLVAGVVFWSPQGQQLDDDSVAATAKPDRIFTSQDRIFSMSDVPAASGEVDNLFRSDFNDG